MKEWFYQNIEHVYNAVKFLGIIDGLKIGYHFVYVSIFRRNKGKGMYSFLHLKFAYTASSSLIELFSDIFTNNPYFFKSKTKSPVIIDIGANIGDSLLYFKYLYPESRVYAYEPHPQAFELLKKNIELNQFHDVISVNTALAAKKSTMLLYSDNSENYRSSGGDKEFIEKVGNLLPYTSKLHNAIKVPVSAFSSEYSRLKLKTIDLLKIDAEGAETDILQDLDAHDLLKRIHMIILEYHLTASLKNNSFDAICAILMRNHFIFDCYNIYRHTNNVSNNPTLLVSSKNTKFKS